MEKIKVGEYLVIGDVGDYQVMEQFGDYRMLKKKFKTTKLAIKKAESLNNYIKVNNL